MSVDDGTSLSLQGLCSVHGEGVGCAIYDTIEEDFCERFLIESILFTYQCSRTACFVWYKHS